MRGNAISIKVTLYPCSIAGSVENLNLKISNLEAFCLKGYISTHNVIILFIYVFFFLFPQVNRLSGPAPCHQYRKCFLLEADQRLCRFSSWFQAQLWRSEKCLFFVKLLDLDWNLHFEMLIVKWSDLWNTYRKYSSYFNQTYN